jgi:hypothetical protein
MRDLKGSLVLRGRRGALDSDRLSSDCMLCWTVVAFGSWTLLPWRSGVVIGPPPRQGVVTVQNVLEMQKNVAAQKERISRLTTGSRSKRRDVARATKGMVEQSEEGREVHTKLKLMAQVKPLFYRTQHSQHV